MWRFHPHRNSKLNFPAEISDIVIYTAWIEAKCAQELLQAYGHMPQRCRMIIIKEFKKISWLVALLICLLFPVAGNCEEYQVMMRDGRIIKTRQYYEKNGTIFLLRYGNYIGFDKNEVTEIVKIPDSSETVGSNPSKQKSSGAKTSASQKASADKVKSAQAPVKRLLSSKKKSSP
jgi:hypothetical protein